MASPREVFQMILSSVHRPDVPAEVIDEDVFSDGSDMAITYSGGLALVSAVGEGDEWMLTVTGGVAVEVPDISGVAQWVNSQNRRVAYGRYYYAVGANERVAVVYEDCLPGKYIDMSHQYSRSLVNTRTFTIFGDSADTGRDLVANFGGQLFPLDSAQVLFVG